MSSRNINWQAIETEYISTNRPVLQIANDYGVTEGAIRARAKKQGWVRNILPVKRAKVAQRIAGVTTGATNNEIRNALEKDVDDSVEDMNGGLDVARRCITRLKDMVDMAGEPKDIKVIAEANRIAVETIRRIRGLDDDAAADIVISNPRATV